MAYIDKTVLKLYLGISETADDNLLDAIIERAQAIIDSQVGRTFEAPNDSTRYFDACAFEGPTLYLDHDLCTITSVVNGDAETLTDYKTDPRNGTPYYALVLKSGAWTAAESEIAITGRWAYSASPPKAIVHAAIRLAAWFYRQKDNHADLDRTVVVGNSTILPAKLPADIAEILHPFRRLVP